MFLSTLLHVNEKRGVLNTGASLSLTVKCVIPRDRDHFYGFDVQFQLFSAVTPISQ
jgi:hypothetical protein